jgi:hypothetical protein
VFGQSLHKDVPGPLVKGAVVILCATAFALAAACSDDASEQSIVAREETRETPLFERTWLDVTERAKPQAWLVSRMTKTAVAPEDPAVGPVAAMLETASQQFRESPRMIANRAVQLEGMLAEVGLTEPAVQLIEALSIIAPDEHKAESFGAVCQHYFNLRLAGLGRDEALADLKRRYGAR